MAIRYSLCVYRILNKENEAKVYAHTQYTDVVTFDQLAKHVSAHDSKYNRSDVHGVLTTLVDCIYELLLDGKRVQLGDLGTFYCSIHSKGADSVDSFTVSDIDKLGVNWERGARFKYIINDAEFQRTSRRNTQSSAITDDDADLRAKLAEIRGTSSTDDSSSSSGTGDDSGSSSGDSSGSGGSGGSSGGSSGSGSGDGSLD